MWSAARGTAALPAQPQVLAAYLAERAETCAPATVAGDLTGIAWRHRMAGVDSPAHG